MATNNMGSNEKTSNRVASIASAMLRMRNIPTEFRSVAGSALTQAPDKRQENEKKDITLNPRLFSLIRMGKK